MLSRPTRGYAFSSHSHTPLSHSLDPFHSREIMRTVHPFQTTTTQHLQMASVATADVQGQLAPPLNSKDLSRSGSPVQPNLNILVNTISASLSSNNSNQNTLQVPNNQSAPQPLSANTTSPPVPSIPPASPATIANSDPNASIQSILAASKKGPSPVNGQIPPWNSSAGSISQHEPGTTVMSQVSSNRTVRS